MFSLIFVSFLNSIIEFLPISSGAHARLIFAALELDYYEVFSIFSQLGIVLTLCIFYRKLIWKLFLGFFFSKEIRMFCYRAAFLCFCAASLGWIVMKTAGDLAESWEVMAFSLASLGFVMIFAEKWAGKRPNKTADMEKTTWTQNFYIGALQSLSSIPGVSRSGSSVLGGLMGNLDKKTAVEYSFFVCIPISVFSCIFNIFKYRRAVESSSLSLIAGIFLLNFIFSLFFIKKVLKFFVEADLKFFGCYRIIIALLILRVLM
ncbi:MAG: hypothetical protein LBB09_03635 [Rickettsiales bacterium]|jgi:undecaprenyl-diphosphatase|nr:hypothetical protein [Rickettsiales bacterium]